MEHSRIQHRVCAGITPKSALAALCLSVILVPILMPQNSSPPVVTGNSRVDKLPAQMTLEERINLIHGGPEAQPGGIGGAGTWPGLRANGKLRQAPERHISGHRRAIFACKRALQYDESEGVPPAAKSALEMFRHPSQEVVS